MGRGGEWTVAVGSVWSGGGLVSRRNDVRGKWIVFNCRRELKPCFVTYTCLTYTGCGVKLNPKAVG